MNKLINIRGYWDMFYGTDFNTINMFEGQILLDNDGWFEGIVKDPYGLNTENRFIFGFYHQEKGIYLNKLTINENGLNYVCSYDTTKNTNGYNGEFFEILSQEIEPCGNCYIDTSEHENQNDISILINSLDNLKQDEFLQTFYTSIIEKRNVIIQLIKMSSTTQAFTGKEIIMDVISKFIKEALQKTDDKTKKLILTYSINNVDN